ncbi:hypothetical protein IFM89_033033, partial [Coptis chinensis]
LTTRSTQDSPPPPLLLSGYGVRHGIENNGPSASQGPNLARINKFLENKKFLRAAIVAAFVLISFGILFFMLKCCKGKQRGDKFSKSHKMGASNARMGKFDDIESYDNSQNVTEKGSLRQYHVLFIFSAWCVIHSNASKSSNWVNHGGDMEGHNCNTREYLISVPKKGILHHLTCAGEIGDEGNHCCSANEKMTCHGSVELIALHLPMLYSLLENSLCEDESLCISAEGMMRKACSQDREAKHQRYNS